MVYVLRLESKRHAFLETEATFTEAIHPLARKSSAEAVLVLHGKQFTHIATGDIHKGRITLRHVTRLVRPLQLLEMPLIIPARLRPHAQRIFTSGGRLPPKTNAAILKALAYLMPELKSRLDV